MINYAQEERADALIEQLSKNKDKVMRYGAMYLIGSAYIGTGNNKAIYKLLHFAVSDNDDNVRRAAVINLGFILFKNYTQVPKMLASLSLSYNAHVRYGVALAVGISCAGTGLPDAIKMIEPMLKDQEKFVR